MRRAGRLGEDLRPTGPRHPGDIEIAVKINPAARAARGACRTRCQPAFRRNGQSACPRILIRGPRLGMAPLTAGAGPTSGRRRLARARAAYGPQGRCRRFCHCVSYLPLSSKTWTRRFSRSSTRPGRRRLARPMPDRSDRKRRFALVPFRPARVCWRTEKGRSASVARLLFPLTRAHQPHGDSQPDRAQARAIS